MNNEYQTKLLVFMHAAFETVFFLWNMCSDLKMGSEIEIETFISLLASKDRCMWQL